MFERRLIADAFRRRARKIGELQFHEKFVDRARLAGAGEIAEQLLVQFPEPFLALRERDEILRKCPLVAQRLPLAMRLDRTIVDAAAKLEKFESEFPKHAVEFNA